jgi:hypothetical protein
MIGFDMMVTLSHPDRTMTQAKTRTNLVALIGLLFRPETWTLSEPTVKTDYTPDTKPPIVCTLLPPSTQTFEQYTGWNTGGDGVQSQYAIDIQLSFLFPNNLLFHQLPIAAITEAMGWLCVLVTKHSGLLSTKPEELIGLTNWQYGNLNPCWYQNHENECNITAIDTSWEIAKIQETKIKDWLVLVSFQARIKESCPIAEYIPTPSPIVNSYPNQLAGIPTSPLPPFVLINNFIYGQFVPVDPGTLNSDDQKYPHPYIESDTPAVGHNASFDVVIQQAVKGTGTIPIPTPLPPVTGVPLT